MSQVTIIGAGLAGLSCAIALAEQNISSTLVSKMASERSQSALAEGGINAAINTMGEGDEPEYHFRDTMKGGCCLADPNAVRNLTNRAPEILRHLISIGAPLHMEGGKVVLRFFGGQKKRRTAYAMSSTGKILMTALIDEARRYENEGLIRRFPHHEFVRLLLNENRDSSGNKISACCGGVRVLDTFRGEMTDLIGPVVLCSGGMNGMFPRMTTGTTLNSGDVTASVFSQGVLLSNLEMIQFHPTTIGIPGKRLLVSEAARGEGGRLYIERHSEKWHFCEEKYPELGNLMPRDVVSREMYFVVRREDCSNQVYLDMTELSDKVFSSKLSDLRDEIIRYLGIDPKKEPVPVSPGIHYFMGGIDIDVRHRTNLPGLYAAGECACQYHGANRLGGNSMLGAMLGGRIAAEELAASAPGFALGQLKLGEGPDRPVGAPLAEEEPYRVEVSETFAYLLRDILLEALGIVRSEEGIHAGMEKLEDLANSGEWNLCERNRLDLARAMLVCADARKESRGAHYREDFPVTKEEYRKTGTVRMRGQKIIHQFREIPEEQPSVTVSRG